MAAGLLVCGHDGGSMMSPEQIVSHGIAFLVGIAVGAAGHYFGEMYTDRRREQEAQDDETRAFRRLAEQMPDLLRAMKADLEGEPTGLVREFFVLSTPGVSLGFARPHFRYNESEIANLPEKVELLVGASFVDDITGTGAPKYRLSEDFVERLRAWRPRR